MNRQSTNQKTIHRFFALAVYCLSALLITAQTATAYEPFNFTTEIFPVENLTNANFLSPQSVFVVNTTGDQNDQVPGDGFCNDGAGNCSLRAAIQEANAFSGANVIDFNIPGNCGTQTIMPNSPLPAIIDPVTIDGYSQSGALPNTQAVGENAVICVMVNGTNAGSNVDGLTVSAVNTTIRGLAVGSFTDVGILVLANGGIVEGNFIGTNQSGVPVRANRIGIAVQATNVLIGGTTLASRNIIKNSTRFGIALDQGGGSNTVQNNYISSNGETGISIFRSGGNLIGGVPTLARNVISGNGMTATGGLDGSGISIYGDTNFNQSANNTIQENYIGTDAFGSGAFGNKTDGILINGAINTTVSGNLVSGNLIDGIGITGNGATGNVVKSNIVGLDAAQDNALANGQDGVSIYAIPGNTVGGTNAGDGNRIAGNTRFGVLINGPNAGNNLIQGNNVGFNLNNAAKPNNGGIAIYSSNNIVGGTAAGARNYIAGNNSYGVRINYASGVSVLGNNIGILAGGAMLGNVDGIFIQDATDNFIGGTTAGAGNIISGNQVGIHLIRDQSATSGNQILGNFIGTTANGMTGAGNGYGIFLQKADNNVIGGTTAAARNLISDNLTGIFIEASANNQIFGNYIGTNISGSAALPNQGGITLTDAAATGNVIGGTATGAGNVISGNQGGGIGISSRAASNRVEGNIIGLNASGTAALPNVLGIGLNNGQNNIIGGTATGAGNVISGNIGDGISFGEGASGNSVQGNKIGTDATGMNAFQNNIGVRFSTGPANIPVINNIIGGTTAAARNIISGNQNGGVLIAGINSNNNTVAGNYIGIKADGISPLSNNSYGVSVNSPNTIIGGATSASRNVISGQSDNAATGVYITGNSSGSNIQNNYIGTTADGNSASGNFTGIQLLSDGVTIDSNVISDNSFCGICAQAVIGGYIINNKIGTNAAGTALLGNNQGIYLLNAANFRIGFDTNGNGAPNIIAGSTLNGIRVFGSSSVGNLFYANSIYGNGELGIDLGNNGVTQNDNQDADGGPNNFQNFPIINNATTTISGNFNSTPNRQFRLEFFSSPAADPTGYGEGQTFIVAQNVNTDASGNATFSVANPQPLGSYISATAIDLTTGDTSEFSAYKQTLAPTAVSFNGARATAFENGVLVEWQTGRESDNLGFNVYRERNGKRELITKNLVAGSALTASENLLSEQNYSRFDANGDKDSTYFIESVDVRGVKEIYGSFQAEAKNGKNIAADSMTLNQLGQSETASTVTVEPTVKLNAKLTDEQTQVQNALAANKAVKLTVRRAGIYRVTAERLFANGLPANSNAANLQLFADGIEQPIKIVGAENGVFDADSAIEFYGVGTDTTETDARAFYLVASSENGLRMSKTDLQGQPANADFYTATVERRDRTIYFPALLNGDEDNFFGAVITNAETIQTINAARLATNGGAAELEISLQGITFNQHSVSVELNGRLISTVNFSDRMRGTARISLQPTQLRDGENTVRLIANNQNDVSAVDYLRLTYPRLYRAENNSLGFSAEGGQEISVGNFTSKNIRVFDLTNPNEAFEITAHLSKSATLGKAAETDSTDLNAARNYAVRFSTTGTGTRRLLAITDDQLAETAGISLDNPSNLRDRRNAADLVIVTRREFFDALAPLVALRAKQGLIVNLVDVSDIYDEFSFGRKSSAAIREFLNYTQTNWRKNPQFVLFGGDATYDPKDYLGNPDADAVQTKLVDTDSVETASDEWLADFNGDGVGEMSIGRLPARTSNEMSVMVGKIVSYERQTPTGSTAFVADTNDGYDFAAANRSISSLLPQSFEVTEIRREDANAKSRLMNAVNSGQSLISYSGHGSNNLWRGNLLTNSDAAGMTNDVLPMFVMMTCLNGYFQNPAIDSLGEALLRNPSGGAVAVWASSGTTTPDSQTELNRQFVRVAYGQNLTVGQAVRAAKNSTTNRTVRQTWTLLGDPTMRLK